MNVKALFLTKYGVMGASSRLRTIQYLPKFRNAGLQTDVQSLFSDEVLAERYKNGRYSVWAVGRSIANRIAAMLQRKKFDVLWIEKEALPWWPMWIEAGLLRGVPYVLDYDDAVFHNYDQHSLSLVRKIYGRRLDGLMAKAALVVTGNDYLAQRAKDAGAPWVELLPTVIDLERYPSKPVGVRPDDGLPRIVWIGSPSTARYLGSLRQSLLQLAARVPFVLRVIGAEWNLPGVNVECLPWSEDTEVALLAQCDVGIMPLQNSAWERGKCGYKLIQYMACGLSVVASPVGVNASIVQVGVNGFLAGTDEEWVCALEKLLTEPDLRLEQGFAGRKRVEQEFSLQVTGPRLAHWLQSVAQRG